GQFPAGVAFFVLRIGGRAIASTDEIAFVLIVVGAGQLQTQNVLNQRYVDVRAGLPGVFVEFIGFGRHRVLGGDAATEFIRDFFGDDVDHTTHGVGAVQGRCRPADDLDALDGL